MLNVSANNAGTTFYYYYYVIQYTIVRQLLFHNNPSKFVPACCINQTTKHYSLDMFRICSKCFTTNHCISVVKI